MSPRALATLTVVLAVVAALLAFSAVIVKYVVERRLDLIPIVAGIVLLVLAGSAWSRYRGMSKK